MESWQKSFLFFFIILNLVVFLLGLYQSKVKQNAYGLIPYFFLLGIFAWGDAVIFGIFWILAAVSVLLTNNWYLFLLVYSSFWLIRSLGETIYWFNQQFSPKTPDWNRPEKLPLHGTFHNDSIWFIYQTIWQCISVISLITTIYFASIWLRSITY